MIATGLIDIVNWLIQNLFYPLFPHNLPFLPFNTYVDILNSIKTSYIYVFGVLDNFFPVPLLLTFILVVLTGEITLFLVKGITFIINLVRGSGA